MPYSALHSRLISSQGQFNNGHLLWLNYADIIRCYLTSLTAHIRAIDPMLLVIDTSVALARSALLTLLRGPLLIMWPKLLPNRKTENNRIHKNIHLISYFYCMKCRTRNNASICTDSIQIYHKSVKLHKYEILNLLNYLWLYKGSILYNEMLFY